MVSDTGENLSVLIVSETSVPNEWMSYSSWYSFSKNAPDAKICISCQRTQKRMHQLMNWANRLKINYQYHTKFSNDSIINRYQSIICAVNKGYIKFPLLVVEPDVMLIKEFQPSLFDQKFLRSSDNKMWFLASSSKEEMENVFDSYAMNKSPLDESKIVDAVSSSKDKSGFIVSINDGMGRFNTRTWINKDKGCPFGKAFRFYKDDMTVNERRILELWGQMAPLFKAVF